MGLLIYNSLTRRSEPFETVTPGAVRMYVCGPNLYGPAHVGHALSYTFFDVVRRYLEYRGYAVRHVQNFTDIEDRIVERARREGRSITEIAVEYLDQGGGRFGLHYDSRDENLPLGGAYKPAETVEVGRTGAMKTHVFRVDDAAFRSRENSGADFRIWSTGVTPPLRVARVTVRKAG